MRLLQQWALKVLSLATNVAHSVDDDGALTPSSPLACCWACNVVRRRSQSRDNCSTSCLAHARSMLRDAKAADRVHIKSVTSDNASLRCSCQKWCYRVSQLPSFALFNFTLNCHLIRNSISLHNKSHWINNLCIYLHTQCKYTYCSTHSPPPLLPTSHSVFHKIFTSAKIVCVCVWSGVSGNFFSLFYCNLRHHKDFHSSPPLAHLFRSYIVNVVFL